MRRWFALLAALLLHAAAWAHKPSDSYLTLRATEGADAISVRWDIALRDLDYVLQLDRDGNGELSWGEVRQRGDDIARYATGHLQLSSGDKACPLQPAGVMMLDKHSDGTYAVLTLTARCEGLAGALKARYSLLFDVDPSHRGLVQWIAPGGDAAQALIFGTESAEQKLALKPPQAWETLRQYVVEGVWHIWIGFDHILFLLALLLPAVLVRRSGQWQGVDRLRGAVIEVLKVVTAFTLAHSITLTLAALQLVTLPSRLVESVIAASVILAALNNLRGTYGRPPLAADGVRPPRGANPSWGGPATDLADRRWVLAFAFGLIHGFGFASVLADLGLPQDALVLALVGFNVGVELGQLAIVAVFLPLAFRLRGTRFYRVGVLKAGSLAVAALAAWWLVERMFDL